MDEAWRNFTGMSGTTTDWVLSEADMEEIMKEFKVTDEIINPLVEECKNSPKGWENRKTSKLLRVSSYGYGQCWYYYKGSWGAVLGRTTFTAVTNCTCRKLSWNISIHDPFDMDPLFTWCLHRDILVGAVRITNWALACGWTDFDIGGEISGEVPIPCD